MTAPIKHKNEMSIRAHITELKKRFLFCFILFIVIFVVLYPYANTLFNYYAHPIIHLLPYNAHLITLDITASFFVPLRLNTFITIAICLPILIFNIWQYFKPLIHHTHQNSIRIGILFSFILFYTGIYVGYTQILSLVLNFFIQSTPSSTTTMISMLSFINFSIWFLMFVGLIFQIPILLTVLVSVGLVEYQKLKKFRRYAFVLSFIVAMLIAPDIFLQFAFGIPIYLLYEVGLILAFQAQKKQERKRKQTHNKL